MKKILQTLATICIGFFILQSANAQTIDPTAEIDITRVNNNNFYLPKLWSQQFVLPKPKSNPLYILGLEDMGKVVAIDGQKLFDMAGSNAFLNGGNSFTSGSAVLGTKTNVDFKMIRNNIPYFENINSNLTIGNSNSINQIDVFAAGTLNIDSKSQIRIIGNTQLNGNARGRTLIGGAIGDFASPSAILEVKSIQRGVLLPRMDSYDRDNRIKVPVDGLLIFNIQYGEFQYYFQGQWLSIVPSQLTGRLTQNSIVKDTLANKPIVKSPTSFVTSIGDGKTKVFEIEHNLGSDFVMVQFIDCGAEANCNRILSIPNDAVVEMNGNNKCVIRFNEAPSFRRYKIMVLKVN